MNTIKPNNESLILHVLGLGINDKAQLTTPASDALLNADWVVGSNRQLEVVADFLFEHCKARPKGNHQSNHQCNHQSPQRLVLPPLKELKIFIEGIQKQATDKNQSVVILASGDPLFYGIGGWVSRTFRQAKVNFYPAVSSVQGTCHALGLSLQDVKVISLHGRPLQKIRRQLKSHETLVILTDQFSQPRTLAQECLEAGFVNAKIHVCEALGYPHEKVRSFSLEQLIEGPIEFDALHVSVIETREQSLNSPSKRVAEFPGIQDQAFFTDSEKGKGMITKREVRLNILSLLQPSNGDVIWDVGAGCGSVAVELCYWNDKVQVHAIEHHTDRIDCLQKNKRHFGVVSNLHVVPYRAPQAFEGLPNPNKVFIGGSDGELGSMLQSIWEKLPVGGLLVASSVMEGSRQDLIHFYQVRQQQNDGPCETLQVAISRGGELAGQLIYRPALAVTLFKWVKTQL